MDQKYVIDHMDHRLDRIEEKLDSHLERVAALEANTKNMQGSIKWLFSIFVSTISTIAGILVHQLMKGGK